MLISPHLSMREINSKQKVIVNKISVRRVCTLQSTLSNIPALTSHMDRENRKIIFEDSHPFYSVKSHQVVRLCSPLFSSLHRFSKGFLFRDRDGMVEIWVCCQARYLEIPRNVQYVVQLKVFSLNAEFVSFTEQIHSS